MAAATVRIGILGSRTGRRSRLRRQLEAQALEVVVETTLDAFVAAPEAAADVLLLDLEQASDAELDQLELLLERSGQPMVFYDGGGQANCPQWWGRFAAKLIAAAAERAPTAARAAAAPALRVWVLGASFGGPDALKRFFSALPEPLEVALIIGQHIGDGFVEVLAAQLNRVTGFYVEPAQAGCQLEHGRVYVAPVRQRLHIDADDRIRLEPEAQRLVYTPSIDCLMHEVACRYGANAGGIIFSGMGDDGSAGARSIAAAGGEVWVQEAATCAIDSMPACAQATGLVSRSGSPERLAKALAERMNTVMPQMRAN